MRMQVDEAGQYHRVAQIDQLGVLAGNRSPRSDGLDAARPIYQNYAIIDRR
jgi:hypothetical protein